MLCIFCFPDDFGFIEEPHHFQIFIVFEPKSALYLYYSNGASGSSRSSREALLLWYIPSTLPSGAL